MKRSIEGVTFERVAFIRAVDGDTIIVRPRGFTSDVRVRILDCWCEETKRGPVESREKGKAAKVFAESRCDLNADHLTLHVPFPEGAVGIWDGLMKAITLGRVVGNIWLDDEHTLAEAIIKHGLGLREKPAGKPEKE